MTKINDAVAEKIKALSEPVFDRVVDSLVEREASRRTDAIVKVMDKIDSAQRELRKIKPDVGPFYDEEGNLIEGSAKWTKAKLEERKKAQEKINKMQNAVEKAIEGDMQDVYKFTND